MKKFICICLLVFAMIINCAVLIGYSSIVFPKAHNASYNYFFIQTDYEPMKVQGNYITGSASYKLVKVKSYKHLAELKALYPEDAESFLNDFE